MLKLNTILNQMVQRIGIQWIAAISPSYLVVNDLLSVLKSLRWTTANKTDDFENTVRRD